VALHFAFPNTEVHRVEPLSEKTAPRPSGRAEKKLTVRRRVVRWHRSAGCGPLRPSAASPWITLGPADGDATGPQIPELRKHHADAGPYQGAITGRLRGGVSARESPLDRARFGASM
jgi:hypothetical protein